MSETAIAKEAIAKLEELGALCVRVNSGQAIGLHGGRIRLAKKGTPDWLVILYGACMLEFKQPGEKPTTKQLEWHAKCRARGVPVHVVTSTAEAVRAVTGAT